MKRPRLLWRVLFWIGAPVIGVAAWEYDFHSPDHASSPTQANSPQANSTSSDSTPADSTSSNSTASSTSAGSSNSSAVRFETLIVNDTDPSGFGGEYCRMLIPAGWKTQGGLVYDYNMYYPAQTNLRIYDPNSSAWFASYPDNYYMYGNLNMAPGTNNGGFLVEQPKQDLYQAIEQIVIPQYRTDISNATVVETEDLPKMADAARSSTTAPGSQETIQAGRLRLEYTANGNPVQEDFFGVLRVEAVPGQAFETWDLEQVISVRADKGKMDDVRKLHEASARSCKPALAWYNAYMQLLAARKANVAAFQESMAEYIHQNVQATNTVDDSIRQEYDDQQAAEDRISEARSETMRGETPWDAGDGNKVLLPADYDHAWQDGNGQYVISSDPNYDPNTDPNLIHSTWTAMQQLQQLQQ